MLTRSATSAIGQFAVAKQARKSVALRASGVETPEVVDPKVRRKWVGDSGSQPRTRGGAGLRPTRAFCVV